jgi:hypothetical protein
MGKFLKGDLLKSLFLKLAWILIIIGQNSKEEVVV